MVAISRDWGSKADQFRQRTFTLPVQCLCPFMSFTGGRLPALPSISLNNRPGASNQPVKIDLRARDRDGADLGCNHERFFELCQRICSGRNQRFFQESAVYRPMPEISVRRIIGLIGYFQ